MKNKTISDILSLMVQKKISATELILEYINKIKKDKFNIVITDISENGLERAKLIDKKIAKGEISLLSGIPVCVKDAFCTKNIRTTCASKMLKDFIPQYESTVTQKLLDQDAILLAKTNQDEFCMGSSSTNSYFGSVINPLFSNEKLVAGGSSGGSAAAVASEMCVFALGTDTGGSVRQPAAFCNIFGLKPTYGRCSRYGIVAFASSLDQASILTNNTEDAASVLNIISGPDIKDGTTYSKKDNDFLDKNFTLKGKKIAILKETFANEVDEIIQNRIKQLFTFCEKEGAFLEEVSMENSIRHGVDTYYVIACAEATSNLARFDGLKYGGEKKNADNIQDLYKNTRSECFGTEVKNRILLGNIFLSSEGMNDIFLKAAKIRRLIYNEFIEIFDKYDFLCMPTTATFPFKIDEKLSERQMWFNDIFTIPVSLAGAPGLNIPIGMTNEIKMPIGVQFVSKHFAEKALLSLSYFIEKNFNNN